MGSFGRLPKDLHSVGPVIASQTAREVEVIGRLETPSRVVRLPGMLSGVIAGLEASSIGVCCGEV